MKNKKEERRREKEKRRKKKEKKRGKGTQPKQSQPTSPPNPTAPHMRVPFQLPTAHSAVSIHGSLGAIAVKEGVGGVSSLSPEPLVELPPSPSAKGHVATSVTIAEFLFPGKSQTLDAMEEAVVGVGGSALSGVSAIGLASVTYDDFSEGEVGVILSNFSNCISSPIKSRFGAITSLCVFTNVYAWCRLIRLDCITYAIVTVDDRDIPAVQCTMHFAFSVAFAKLINSKAGAKNEGLRFDVMPELQPHSCQHKGGVACYRLD